MDMKLVDSVPLTKHRKEKPCCVIHHTTRKQHHQCKQAETVAPKQTTAQQQQQHFSNELAPSHSPISHKTLSSIIPMRLLVVFLLVVSFLSPVLSLSIVSDSGHSLPANQTLHPAAQLHKLKRVTAYLTKINKPAVKTIQANIYTFVYFMVFLYVFLWLSDLGSC
jgi:hypothetical protein